MILTAMTASDTVSAIVQILTEGITSFGTGLAGGIQSFVTALAYNADQSALSVFFILVLAMASIGVCVGITTRLFLWLSSLGRN